ncbi:MAG: type IV pili methyl-accepting chemotaxis transducer N-terminal domain-containing protein, partial [Gammaproteobacteria bacterium]|nr:type IV pili methyl-accepting chemotaxis transducer N-terminal domain-containing protein [Gammaproteobacteria bacterium]
MDGADTVFPPEDKTVLLRRASPADPRPEAMQMAANDDIPDDTVSDESLGPNPEAASTPRPAIAARRSNPARQQRLLAVTLGVMVLLLLIVAGSAILRAERLAQQVASTGQALMQSQRLAKSVSQALVGNVPAFAEVKDSSDDLTRRVQGLVSGDDSLKLERVGGQYESELAKITPLAERAEKSAKAVLAQQKILTQVGTSLRDINRQSSDLLEMTETVASLKLQQNATLPEISAAGQLVMLTQRIGKSANEFLTVEGVSPDAVFLLGKDLNTFQEVTRGLLDGSAQQRLPGSRDPQTRKQLESILKTYEQTRTLASGILGNLQGLVAARDAQATILADSEP